MNEEESLWFKKYGFFSNPFSIKPAPFDFKVIGQDKILEDLYYKVPNGNMAFIEGKFGNGKSLNVSKLISLSILHPTTSSSRLRTVSKCIPLMSLISSIRLVICGIFSSNCFALGLVIQVTFPSRALSIVVVRKTSPNAPNLIIKVFFKSKRPFQI